MRRATWSLALVAVGCGAPEPTSVALTVGVCDLEAPCDPERAALDVRAVAIFGSGEQVLLRADWADAARTASLELDSPRRGVHYAEWGDAGELAFSGTPIVKRWTISRVGDLVRGGFAIEVASAAGPGRILVGTLDEAPAPAPPAPPPPPPRVEVVVPVVPYSYPRPPPPPSSCGEPVPSSGGGCEGDAASSGGGCEGDSGSSGGCEGDSASSGGCEGDGAAEGCDVRPTRPGGRLLGWGWPFALIALLNRGLGRWARRR